MSAAEVRVDQRTHEQVVSFKLSVAGAQKLGTFTQQNIGKSVATVVDGEVLRTFTISEPIYGGSGQVSSIGEIGAKALAIQLHSGRLPATFAVVQERLIEQK